MLLRLVLHAVLRTQIVENIATLAPSQAGPFLTMETVKLLWAQLLGSKVQGLRRTVAAALARIVHEDLQLVLVSLVVCPVLHFSS
jgi:hypothetical protein